jgi:pyruvate kinase
VRRQRSSKIVATLGPASSSPDVIARLFTAGADVFRINMSHAKPELMRELVDKLRAAEAAFDRPIGILADLQGPKLRIGEVAGGSMDVPVGAEIVLDLDAAAGSAGRVGLPHPEIFAALETGHALLVDDGRLRFRVTDASPKSARVVVEVGGKLSSRKGVSLPDTVLPVGALTAKDRTDLEAALAAGCDWIALSFVQRPDDIAEVKKIARGRAGVLAKIEKPVAVDRLGEILELSDALMIARGDLGVELPMERVPGIQKMITRTARRLGKPVIVATQMLESMITAPVPTRAEVSDVATAVFDGADAVMLSAESAAGQYPVEAVAMMDRICREVEGDANYRAILSNQRQTPEQTGADTIAEAARSIAERLNLACILSWTSSGSTALRVARERPGRPVLALTPSIATARRLAVVWGTHCVNCEDAHDLDDMVDRACRIAFREGFAKPGQRVIITAGVPLGTPGATNMLRIAFVGGDSDGV